jgi:pyrroline-5-carboxylate reductase
MAMDKFDKKIAIIGGGHIGQALTEGFINSGKIPSSQLVISNPSLDKITYLTKQGIEITSDNTVAVKKADIIFLAVKPLIAGPVLREINNLIKGKTVISLAAVVSIRNLKKYAKNAEIVRIMPNMAVACNQGIIGFFGNNRYKNEIIQLVSVLGSVIDVEKEEDLDSLTILSGCGPAIVSQFIELLAGYGAKVGLSTDKSQTIAFQTLKGTTAILEKSKLSPNQLIQLVSTKGGISEAILNSLNTGKFNEIFNCAMNAGYSKIQSLRNVYTM